MSYTELRELTESLRQLSFPRHVSISSFRNPNFEMVSDILFWLTRKLDPNATLVCQIETESDRIAFLHQCSNILYDKANIKLNMRRVYRANNNAVPELIKITSFLIRAMTRVDVTNLSEDMMESELKTTQIVTSIRAQSTEQRAQESKALRSTTSTMTQLSSALHFLVEREPSMRLRRVEAAERHIDLSESERRIQKFIAALTKETEELTEQLESLQNDEKSLEQKMDHKRAQLERQQKRLKALSAVRPSFIEEYEKLEVELKRHYGTYLERYRNVEYLEHEMAKLKRMEDALMSEQEGKLRQLREKLRREELKAIRGEADPLDRFTEEMIPADMLLAAQGSHDMRPRAASGRQRPPISGAPSYESMTSSGAGSGIAGASSTLGFHSTFSAAAREVPQSIEPDILMSRIESNTTKSAAAMPIHLSAHDAEELGESETDGLDDDDDEDEDDDDDDDDEDDDDDDDDDLDLETADSSDDSSDRDSDDKEDD